MKVTLWEILEGQASQILQFPFSEHFSYVKLSNTVIKCMFKTGGWCFKSSTNKMLDQPSLTCNICSTLKNLYTYVDDKKSFLHPFQVIHHCNLTQQTRLLLAHGHECVRQVVHVGFIYQEVVLFNFLMSKDTSSWNKPKMAWHIAVELCPLKVNPLNRSAVSPVVLFSILKRKLWDT